MFKFDRFGYFCFFSLVHTTFAAESHSGKIYLLTEQEGAAMYLNPDDNKLYFVGDDRGATEVVEKLAIGLNNESLKKINHNGYIKPSDIFQHQHPNIFSYQLFKHYKGRCV